MGVTIAKDTDRVERISKNLATLTGTCTFDTSYPSGGETCTDITKYFGGGEFVVMFEGKGGLTFEWDKTNNKVKAFMNAPPVVFEEYQATSSHVATLRWPVAHIDYVASATAPYICVHGAETAATGQVAADVGFIDSTGVMEYGEYATLTFLAADAVTVCYTSYATQAWRELADNMVQARLTTGARTYGHANLAFTAATPDKVTLGEDIVAMMSMTMNDGTVEVPELLDDGGTPAATMETEIDFTVASTFAEVNHFATDAYDASGAVLTYVYIRDPGVGHFIHDRFVNTEITAAADTMTYTGNPLIYGTCGQIPHVTSDKKSYLVTVADAVAATQAHFTDSTVKPNASAVVVLTREAATDDNCTPAWIEGALGEIETVQLECPAATDLSYAGAVRFIAIGLK